MLGIIAVVVFSLMFGGRIKQFAEDAQTNPTRAAASAMVTMSAGQFEMIAEDDVNKRYTVREKDNGKLTTIYWDEKKQAPEIINGDFSAIPAQGATDGEPAVEPAPAPGQ